MNKYKSSIAMDSDSEDYLKTWIPVTNRVKDRLKDRSLVHTFLPKRRIAESTKEFNKYSKKFTKVMSYEKFLEYKKEILGKVSENRVVTDESDFSDNDYIQYYNSFNHSNVKYTGNFDWFSWNEIDKSSKYYKSIVSKEDTQCHSVDAIKNVSIATENKNVSNVKKFDNKLTSSKKVQYDSNSLVEKQLRNKSNESPKLLNNNANGSDTSSSNNVDSKTNNKNKKVTTRASSVKKVHDLENSSSKKIITRKRLTNVKRNLTSVINDVESKVIEPLDEDDWNDEFIPSDFRAQSTQICSDTFTEINHRQNRKSLNNFKLAPNEKVNQPRDSGIEEDSREDNLNNDSLANNKKISNEKKKNLEDKISDDKGSKSKECNLEHRTQNNSNNNELPGNDRDSLSEKNETCINKKLPLKVKEEKITKKYTIVSKGDMKLKPVQEETHILKSDDKAKEDNERENENVDAQITSDKNSEKEEEEEESNYDYQNLQDYGNEEDSNDDKNNSESENDISIEKAVTLNKSTKSKSKKEKKYKNELKNELKRCKSPFMKQKYKELNQLGLLSENEVDSDMGSIIINKENEETEEKIEKPYFSLTPIDMESITNDTSFGENSKNKSEKLKKYKASNEDAIESKESTENDTKMTHNKSNEKYEIEDDDEQDLSEKGKIHLKQMKKIDFFNNSESSDDSEDQNNDKTLTEKTEKILQSSKKYNQQMKRMGLDSSSEDSDDSSNSKKVKNEKEINKTNDKKDKDKNKKNISKSEDISQNKNSNKYNNTENVKKSGQNLNNSNVKSKKCEQEDDLVSNTTSPQSSQSISKSSKLKDTKKKNNKKHIDENLSNSPEQSYEIEKQEEITKVVENYKQLIQSKDKSDASNAEKETSLKTKKDHQVKKLGHGNDKSESSEEGNLKAHDKKKLSINNKINETKHSKKEDKSLNNTTKLHTTSEEGEDDNISSNTKQTIAKLKTKCNQVNSSEDSNHSKKFNIIDSADCDSNIDEHQILKDKIPEAIKSIHQDNSNSSVVNQNSVAMATKLECNKSDKESSCSTSQNIDVEHDSSEAERMNKRKRKISYNSDSSEKNKEIDVVTLSPKALNHLKKFTRLDFSKESEEDSDNEELVKNLNEDKHKNSITDTGSSNLKAFINSSDDESDNEESDREMSPSTTQRLKQFKRMNLLYNSNSSSSEDEDIKVNKSNSPKVHIHSKKADTKISDIIDDIEDEKTHKNSKSIIISETQDTEGAQKEVESQELMFSSLEDLTKGVHQDVSKLAQESGLDSNTEIANKVPPTQQSKKIYTKRIKKISELVEKEDLSEGSYESTMTLKDISDHEEIFILDVPKSVFSDGDLIGKKMTFSKATLMFGDNNVYEAFQRTISPVYSCVFKSENNTKNSFQTLNVRPTREIVTRRKKDFNDSNKQGEENEQSEISLEVSEKSHTAVKTEANASKKLHKKKTNAEDEKEIKSENEKRKGSKVLEKSKTKRGMFHLSNFVDKKKTAMLIEEHKLSEEESDSELKLSLDSENDSIKDEKDEKDDEVFTNISNNLCPKPKKSKTHVGKAANEGLDKETREKKAKVESKSGIAKVKAVNKKSNNTNAPKDKKESDKLPKPSIKKENKSKNKDTNEKKTPVKKESKLKKLKTAITEDKPEPNEPIAGPSSGTAAKKPKTVKKKANNETKSVKRKAETNAGDDVVVNPKKRKVAAEKKPKAPAITNKTTVAMKPSKKTPPKKKKPPMAEAAAKEILTIIQKTMNFNKKKLDSSNSSLDNSKYGVLDIKRVRDKNKRCASTSSSSSDEDGKVSRNSFKVRSNKPRAMEIDSSSSDDDKDKVEVKDDDKKKKKTGFFFEE